MFFAIVKEKGEMPNAPKIETVLKHVEKISNDVNRQLIKDYHRYLISPDTSTNYQKDNIKLMHMFAKFLGGSKTFFDVKDSEPIVAFLDIKRKSKEEDPEQKWITTWNDYLWRLKMFYRWLYNVQLKGDNYMFSILIYPWFKIWHNAYTKKVFINLIDTSREGEIGQSYTCKDTNT